MEEKKNDFIFEFKIADYNNDNNDSKKPKNYYKTLTCVRKCIQNEEKYDQPNTTYIVDCVKETKIEITKHKFMNLMPDYTYKYFIDISLLNDNNINQDVNQDNNQYYEKINIINKLREDVLDNKIIYKTSH